MLAKHVWRLIHDTDSLFYKVFKAKYFPNCSVFEAKSALGSFAWKSRIIFHKGILAQTATADGLIDPNLVKSRYKILCEDQQAGGLETDVAEAQRNFWKGVWKLKVPGKIKHFLWKSCTNSLPTKENLRKRTIIQENVCHLGSDHLEDVKHALWGCSKKNHRLFPLFAVTAWSVWHHRNKSQLQSAIIPLDRVADFAENYLWNFSDRFGQQGLPVRSAATMASWCPPYENQVKINFDGALFGESDSARIGVVIRSSEGGKWVSSIRFLKVTHPMLSGPFRIGTWPTPKEGTS
ncbi:uncharacterized protein LOC126696367 [Quercus robur]|uniref:uncharacterized protein LOC126696367 n=1 Tax=Quercus robur TaxID=38942 RepID=UPI002162C259|nr:uncharacterized protein LOC126696367 [Quercus robur]